MGYKILLLIAYFSGIAILGVVIRRHFFKDAPITSEQWFIEERNALIRAIYRGIEPDEYLPGVDSYEFFVFTAELLYGEIKDRFPLNREWKNALETYYFENREQYLKHSKRKPRNLT